MDLRPTSVAYNVRDDLFLSLLASEAIVDSRGCEILSAEEVEELKKVCPLYLRCRPMLELGYARRSTKYSQLGSQP